MDKYCTYCQKQIHHFDWYHWAEYEFNKPTHIRKCVKQIEREWEEQTNFMVKK